VPVFEKVERPALVRDEVAADTAPFAFADTARQAVAHIPAEKEIQKKATGNADEQNDAYAQGRLTAELLQ